MRAQLEQFVGDSDRWPTRQEFLAAGRHELWSALTRAGGAARWAPELGFELSGARDRRRRGEAELCAQAAEVAETHGHLPGARRLRALGYAKLATAVERAGGAERLAKHCRELL